MLYIMVEVMRTPLDTESDEQRQNRANFIEDLGEGPSHKSAFFGVIYSLQNNAKSTIFP